MIKDTAAFVLVVCYVSDRSPDTEEIIWTWCSDCCISSRDLELWATCIDKVKYLDWIPWRTVGYFLYAEGIAKNHVLSDKRSKCLPHTYWNECLLHFSVAAMLEAPSSKRLSLNMKEGHYFISQQTFNKIKIKYYLICLVGFENCYGKVTAVYLLVSPYLNGNCTVFKPLIFWGQSICANYYTSKIRKQEKIWAGKDNISFRKTVI